MLKCLAMLAMCLACGCDYCPRFTPLKPGTEVFLSHQGVTTIQGDSIGYGGHYDVHYGTKFRVLKGCDRASAKDFHEIWAVFTRGVA